MGEVNAGALEAPREGEGMLSGLKCRHNFSKIGAGSEENQTHSPLPLSLGSSVKPVPWQAQKHIAPGKAVSHPDQSSPGPGSLHWLLNS